MDRAYSLLTLKTVDEEKRILTGIATTPLTDRDGDIVEPKGAEFKLPMPFLWQHDSHQPIGHVTRAKVTAAGIEVEVQIARIEEEGTLKNRIDEAWQSIKAGLVRGMSIGFKPVESARIDGSYGMHFLKWLWLELSAVTVAANASATITQIKSIDTKQRAASGHSPRGAVRLGLSPGVSGNTTASATRGASLSRNPKGNEVKTIAEQLAGLKASRETKSARMESIQTKAVEEDRTKDAAEREEFDTLGQDIESIDSEIKDLEKMERLNIQKAAPVNAGGGAAAAAASARQPVSVKNTQKLEPGIPLARYARCLLLAQGNKMHAAQIAKHQYPEMEWLAGVLDMEVNGVDKGQAMLQKAAVAGGNTTDSVWAAPLVQYQQYAGDFVEFLRPQMIIGKFGTAGIPALRRVPFNVTISGQTSGGNAGWVGEAAPKPLTKFDFANVNLRWAKIAAISVISEELAKFSTPSAEALIRDSLAAAVIARADTDFIDPDKAAVSNVSPASIVNGVSPVASTGGNSAAEIRADIRALFASWISNNVNPANAVFIMSPGTALALSLMYNDLDSARVFPNVGMSGGTLEGIPVIVSQYAANDGGSAGSLVILANASDIYLADDGGVDIAVSREASLQMNDAPDNPATASTVFTSMFQTNQLAIRAEMYINWAKRRTNAVAWMDSVSWGT